MKKILIINGHPDQESYNFALAKAYEEGALSTGTKVDRINIRDLDFNPSLQFGYHKRTDLEPDLVDAIEKIKSADHLVWIFPLWWYSYPAIMKGFIDRTFLPGITYELVEGQALPKKLLKGKSARIIVTADSPSWYNKFFMKDPAIHSLKRGTLEFCGVSPVRVSYVASVKGSSEKFRSKWLERIGKMGRELF
ncbi:NAD(P)H-dependent oxidoreductase [Flammeovirga yaeyamensis]|uniref:NAD(P)H-dependent oxidoreductase n=1 Tax=Flammeovirga yaeyamensis TaxID=367791 RepID=A0AAX1N6L3_9BACT|nr:NAD(P)H-dependent oxidoreductase [Flammeovirga yaeyamensis]MBB3697713.1 putative NADPH-quinone reductase [Flammeovirga yaeyamensis]NMF35929.1 NAD(P)H-dependent oxidoreductase [Flammeovirga yaeyamensis]QWG03121.1 NAD(P)H-dependent oxidoreductase [Flammeovirga yaeyamensis]